MRNDDFSRTTILHMTQHESDKRAFSLAALAEAEAVSKSVAERLAARPAARGITIDGPTSTDLDDAFWLGRLPQGGYQLQVSIADVGSWVTPRQTPALDRAAFRRAFTRYEGERYRPMLPSLLSEDQLSLLEGRLRPAITITLVLDEQLRLSESHIAQTALRSSKRLSYEAAERELDQPQTPLAPMLRLAYEVARGLLNGRRLRGALAAYHLPTGWITTEDGLLRKLGAAEQYKAQLITAEFMILANQAFAHFFASQGILALYRNQKATAVAPERLTLLQLLDTAVQHPALVSPERIRATFQLAMERARYAPTLEGHFGLNLPAYVHMTSPIRRYPDLVNQRILLAVLNGEEPPYLKADLERIAKAVNGKEQGVKEAKRHHYLALHDRHIEGLIAEDGEENQAPSQSLADLDAKTFHSVIRMAAEGQMLFPAVEQEILRRLEAHQLYAHDLFTLLFRFDTSGAAWERVKTAALRELARTPHHAPSMLLMGQHVLGWSAPAYEFSADRMEYITVFQARASVHIAGQDYVSAWQRAPQKSRAKQLASADLITRIAGKESAAFSAGAEAERLADGPGESSCQPADSSALAPASSAVMPNYKGQLLEVVQARRWNLPVYIEVERSGPPHAPFFSVEAMVSGQGQQYSAKGEGTTKAQAEQRAAQRLLLLIPPLSPAAPVPAAPADKRAARSALHEMQQKALIKTITYSYERSGQEHEGLYTCTCAVVAADDQPLAATGQGTTKKQAAQEAAFQMLSLLSDGDRMMDAV
jgi:ribonuclease R